MNILLISDEYPMPDIPSVNAITSKTTAVSDVIRHWVPQHQVVCIREVNIDPISYITYQAKKRLGYKVPLDDIPESYLLDGVTVYPIIWEYTHFFQLSEGKLNHYMDRKINRILRQINFLPDVIISHMPSYSVAYYVRRIIPDVPTIAVLHLADIDFLSAKIGIIHGKRISQQRTKVLNDAFDCVYTFSYGVYQKAAKLDLKYLAKDVVTSGIQKCESEIHRDWKSLAERKVKIIFAGSLIEQKGIHQVLKALFLLKKQYMFEFCILGTGEFEKTLKKYTIHFGLEGCVSFLGQKSRAEVMQYMQEADIFIMPSYHETLGLVYLEAMARGCITIGSIGEGIDGIIIDGENGFLVDSNSEKDIAITIAKVINLPVKELRRVSEAAIATAEIYTEENVADHCMELVQKVIKTAKRTRKI